jgi:large subunit ribosomal protein L24e
MVKCSFCKGSYEFPRGTTVVQKDGTPRYYCSSKCRKNSEMGRDNRKVKWVKKSPENKLDAANKLADKNARLAKK